ncbi:MAG: hypothetical protein KAQ64_04900 [Candidatus Pacebacteria bacterium]|nr:hypothetical protein [Candidatus Paceibacterota bacterium]
MNKKILAIMLIAALLLTVTATVTAQNGKDANITNLMTVQETKESQEILLSQDSILFMNELYIIWELDSELELPEIVKISVGLVPKAEDVNPFNAKWIVLREFTIDEHYVLLVPNIMEMDEGEYSMIVVVDYGEETYRQEVYYSESIFIVDPYKDV